MEAAARDVVKIETATEPRFQELFVAAMAFPHATAPARTWPAVVALPRTPRHGRRRRVARRRRRDRQPRDRR